VPTYGQFCPVAKAAEILTERWTPLIVRELLMGSRRFNEVQQGVPRAPRSLLVQRLRALERVGIIERRAVGRINEYHLTPAGLDLIGVIERMGEWGQRWAQPQVNPADMDPDLLMWDMRRRIHLDRLPASRVVVQFDLRGAHRRSYWLVLERSEVSVCLKDYGFEVDLLVTADSLALHRVWLGHVDLRSAMRDGSIEIEGRRDLVRAFPGWLALGYFASIKPAA
jgi:DNA-binding HxlR family transcriptional regulator